MDLVLHDFVTHRLGAVQFNPNDIILGNDEAEKTIDFEFQYRSKPHPPLFMLLHTKTLYKKDSHLQDTQLVHHGVKISQLLLNTNTHSRVLDFTGSDFHARFEAMTSNLYPEYATMVDDFGGCLVLPLSKIPNSVYMDPHDNKLWGKISLKMPPHIGEANIDPDETMTFEVRAILLYKDLRLMKNEFSTRKVLQLRR